jgi:hypothetical protein
VSFVHDESTYQASLAKLFEYALDHRRMRELFGGDVQQLDPAVGRHVYQIVNDELLLSRPRLGRIQEGRLHAELRHRLDLVLY